MCKIICSSFALGVYDKRSIVPNPNFKWIVRSVLFCRMLHFVYFRRFVDLKRYFWTSIIVHKKRIKWIVSLFWSLYTWCNVWHTQCVILEFWLKQMCNQTYVLNQNFKRIRQFSLIVSVSSFSAFWWSENAISGHRSLHPTKQ